MVADAEIIDSSVYCFHVDPCCSSSNLAIRLEHIRRSSSEEMVPLVNGKKTEYHHSNDVSRYRSVHSQSQVAPDRLRIHCSALWHLLVAQCKSSNQRFQLFDLVSTAHARQDDAFDDSRRCLRTFLWWVTCLGLERISFSTIRRVDLAVAPVARLLHFQDIPLITMGAVSNEFTLQRQTMYSSLFRFGYRTDELGKLISVDEYFLEDEGELDFRAQSFLRNFVSQSSRQNEQLMYVDTIDPSSLSRQSIAELCQRRRYVSLDNWETAVLGLTEYPLS